MRTNASRSAVVSLLALAVMAAPARAEEFYPITGVSATTTDFFPVINLIQGPGVGFDAAEPHDALGDGANFTWVTDAPGGFPSDYIAVAGQPVITIDLGQDVLLSEISVWGYADTNANGLSEFSLQFATDAEGTGGFGDSITFNPTYNPILDATPRQSFPFGESVTARFVELTGIATFFANNGQGPPPGGDRAGLGEVAFAVPEPAHAAALVGLAGLALLGWRRRRS